jgi:hypothetical protein
LNLLVILLKSAYDLLARFLQFIKLALNDKLQTSKAYADLKNVTAEGEAANKK